MKERAVGLLLATGLAIVLLAGLGGTAWAGSQAAAAFAPYQIPPQVPARRPPRCVGCCAAQV